MKKKSKDKSGWVSGEKFCRMANPGREKTLIFNGFFIPISMYSMFQNVATAGPTATTPSAVTNTTQNWRHGPLPELTVKLRPRTLETWPRSRTRTPMISWPLSQMKPCGSVDSRLCLTSMYINIYNICLSLFKEPNFTLKIRIYKKKNRHLRMG